ncbi:MAG: delta-60 repeat domain-containing protein, partial [Salinivirgaceae bacterium]|nr:delta-60 repeat domain-containing protein [Salinivirgaceae bacterium]
MKQLFTALILILAFLTLHAQNPGDFDTTFGDNGVIMTAIGNNFGMSSDLALQPDGKVIVVGRARFGTYQFTMVRYNPDGTLDPTFGEGGIVLTPGVGVQSYGEGIVLQPDGRIILAGYIYDGESYHAVVARYFDDGDLDPTFGNAGICHLPTLGNSVAVALQDDGKIVLAGHSDDKFALARVNADGTIDTSYGVDGYVITLTEQYSYASDLDIQDDGKVVAVGFKGGETSYSDVFVARYTTNGALDALFATDGIYVNDIGGLADFGTAITIQNDGKILIGSHKEIDIITGVPEYDATIIRLNSDGTHDNTFGIDGIATIKMVEEANYVQAITTQPDGKIVFTGSIVTNSAVKYHTYVTRLNSNGSRDQTFADNGVKFINPFNTEDYLEGIAVDENSNIFVCGYSVSATEVYNFTVMKILGSINDDAPEVDVTFANVETTMLDVTLTPNSACASYHFVIMTAADMQMWLPMMGSAANIIKTWGIAKTETHTHHFTSLSPSTNYYVYTLPIGTDGT